MAKELEAWNDGSGIDLESWIGCEGSFSLAIGNASIFWPTFVVFEDYILREGFSIDSLRGFEEACSGDRLAVETVMNHLHISDIHHAGCADLTEDKAILLGDTIASIYRVKLAHDFPDRLCKVNFYQPDDPDNLDEFEISFWQVKHESGHS